MLDLINTILALMYITGTLLVIAGLVLGICAVVQNTQFYASWQRKRSRGTFLGELCLLPTSTSTMCHRRKQM